MLIVFYPFIKKKKKKTKTKTEREMDAFDLLVVPRVDKKNPNDTCVHKHSNPGKKKKKRVMWYCKVFSCKP